MRFFRGRTWFSSLVEIRWHLTGQLLCWTTQGSTQPEQKTWPHGVVSGSSRTLLHKLHLKSGSTVPLKRSNSNPMVSLNPETNLWTPHPRRSKSEEQWGVFLLAGHWWSVRRDLLAPSSPHCLNSTNWPRLFGAFRSASYANSLKLEVRSFSPWKIDIFRFLCTQKYVFCNCKGKGEIRKRWQFLGPFMTRKSNNFWTKVWETANFFYSVTIQPLFLHLEQVTGDQCMKNIKFERIFTSFAWLQLLKSTLLIVSEGDIPKVFCRNYSTNGAQSTQPLG